MKRMLLTLCGIFYNTELCNGCERSGRLVTIYSLFEDEADMLLDWITEQELPLEQYFML